MKKSTKKIFLILPDHDDYLADTVFDGLLALTKENSVNFFINQSPNHLAKENKKRTLKLEHLKDFLNKADLIILAISGRSSREDLIPEGVWHKVVVVDGREAGKTKMFAENFQAGILAREDLLDKVKLYFKREGPYEGKVKALPFGILSEYQRWQPEIKKDLDFTCVFGQEVCPPERKQIREMVEKFCTENNLQCFTKSTRSFFFGPYSKFARKRFWKILARSKIGISIRGAGMDTVRFWEILGNNCGLLTDNIGVFENPKQELNYSRIIEFGEPKDLGNFKLKLKEVKELLDKNPEFFNEQEEFEKILVKHDSKSRVLSILKSVKID